MNVRPSLLERYRSDNCVDFAKRVLKPLKALAFFAAASSSFVGTAARPDTVTNIATIQWDSGATRTVHQSNQIDLPIDRTAILTLSTFQFSADPNGQQMSIPQTLCRGPAGDAAVVLTGAFADTSLSPARVENTKLIRAGEPLIVNVTSMNDNRDPLKIDTLAVTLKTPGGDEETLVLSETDVNTAQFVGLIKTSPVPPQPVKHDCELSLQPGDKLTLDSVRNDGSAIATAPVEVMIDPYGIVFDSRNGKPVDGTKVTLVDADTGAPATAYGDDGIAIFPSTVITGSPVTDARGVQYIFSTGNYRFPFAKPGRYKILVQPPAPFVAPSLSSPADLAPLRRPDGLPFAIGPGSYGAVFVLADPSPVRIDIPVDKPSLALIVRKTASATVAVPGDAVQYRITVTNSDTERSTGVITVSDRLPDTMRLKPDSVRANGKAVTYLVSKDGRDLTITLPPIAIAKSAILTYLLEVRPDARAGQAINRAQAHDTYGSHSPIADAAVRIARDGISDRMTIIGSVTEGGCEVEPGKTTGVNGVRVMMEDGSYAVTGIDGRYHFEGVIPGTHVVQIDPSTRRPSARTSSPPTAHKMPDRPAARFLASSRARAAHCYVPTSTRRQAPTLLSEWHQPPFARQSSATRSRRERKTTGSPAKPPASHGFSLKPTTTPVPRRFVSPSNICPTKR